MTCADRSATERRINDAEAGFPRREDRRWAGARGALGWLGCPGEDRGSAATLTPPSPTAQTPREREPEGPSEAKPLRSPWSERSEASRRAASGAEALWDVGRSLGGGLLRAAAAAA